MTNTRVDTSHQACLSVAQQSPDAVAVHDKAAWLALFAHNSTVEDPVGSAPHIATAEQSVGKERLARFYETFIAPNQIQFHVDRDIVSDLHVMRDTTIEIAMSEEVTVRVPVHLLYELTVEDDALKIQRLAAHWELLPMLKQQLAAGWPFVKVGTASGLRMLKQLGFGGMLGFSRAASGVGESGKAVVSKFIEAFNNGEQKELEALFNDTSQALTFPHAPSAIPISQLASLGGSLTVEKVLASGNVISATARYEHDNGVRMGVVLFEFDGPSMDISSATFYW